MPFRLKNTGATYQCLFNMMFKEQIAKTIEVYFDDMLVKSEVASNHVAHLTDTFRILRVYRMKLNPLKCAFTVASIKFLRFMVNQRDVKANLKKIQALIDMQSSNKTKKVQSLTGRVAALNRFISKAIENAFPSLIH